MHKYKVYLFDFGNVFLNLDLNATKNELIKLGLSEFTDNMIEKNQLYEKGLLTTSEFLNFYEAQFKNTTTQELKIAWNKILLDFPLHRLEFLEKFANNNTCMLLSNINDMHLEHIKTNLGVTFYNRFLACFDAVYYSHLINLRKPDKEIYQHVLDKNNLQANTVFFIDDTKENTTIAKEMGFGIWNIDPFTQDVINLENKIK